MIVWPWSSMARLIGHRVAGGLAAQSVQDAVGYLQRYGYLSASVADPDAVAEATRQFRSRFGLVEGDALDGQVVRAMSWPRCGVPDGQIGGVEESKWNKRRLTYFIESFVNGISPADQADLTQQGINDWAAICDFSATRTTSKASADVVISTGRGRAFNFDGPGGTLAWAYLPNGRDGQLLMRFDLDETFTKDRAARGTQYLHTLSHEWGHIAGLGHSQRPAALMAPYHNPSIGTPQQDDDIPRARGLYGAAVSPPPVTPTQKPEIIIRFDSEPPPFVVTKRGF